MKTTVIHRLAAIAILVLSGCAPEENIDQQVDQAKLQNLDVQHGSACGDGELAPSVESNEYFEVTAPNTIKVRPGFVLGDSGMKNKLLFVPESTASFGTLRTPRVSDDNPNGQPGTGNPGGGPNPILSCVCSISSCDYDGDCSWIITGNKAVCGGICMVEDRNGNTVPCSGCQMI